ncbi:HAD family hydrolase [uncultured Muribaculum sp.]|uniref:HAD family hydrolase n=1 Tax=uncultured Muribaculum sp. TaxID=1918613 RepID=UPI0025DD2388|nr:HAD-IA family hydrolase [uncultured Muribaculum sp.]
MTRLAIFDFDGTLADTQRNIVVTFQDTMRKLGLPVAETDVCAATIGLPLSEGFLKIYPSMSPELVERCAETYLELFEVNKKIIKPQLFPYVLNSLSRLKERGVRMSIASSRNKTSLEEFARDMELAPFMDYILSADDVVKAKPNPEPVLKTLEALNESPENTIVVGDMDVDILMGNRAGCKTIGVTYGNGSKSELETSNADFIIDSFNQITDII